MPPKILRNIIRFPLGAYIALVLLGIAFLSPWFSYPCRIDIAFYNSAYVLLAVLLGFVCCIGVGKLKKRFPAADEHTKFLRIVGVGTLILFLLQLVVVYECSFLTGWDAGMITDFHNYNVEYFSCYPNQLFLTGVFAGIDNLSELVGLERGYVGCTIVGCLHISLAVFLIADIAQKLAGNKAGYCCFALAFVFLGLSPWLLVPYSDEYGMFWTSFILFCYVCLKKQPLRWFGMVFGTIIGYSIKPTVIFVFAAIVVIELVCFVRDKMKKKKASMREEHTSVSQKRRIFIGSIGSVLLACFLGFGIVSSVKNIGIETDKSLSFPFTHFLMMGFNPETGGIYSQEDYVFTKSQSKDERQAANLAVWHDRVVEMGPGGLAEFLAAKSLSNYADGTFAWEEEGRFYVAIYGQNEVFKQFYGIGENKLNIFAPFFQIVWFMVLIGLALFCFLSKRASRFECVVMLSILLLSGFLLLFECRARYLFLYAPYFVLLGVIGWKEFRKRFREQRQSIRGNTAQVSKGL